MFPTIHSFKADDLDTQGYGALADCISCEVTEELNGGFTLEMVYALNGIHSDYLATGNVIMVKPSHNQSKQPFRISQIKKTFSNNIKVYANHISYDMSGYTLRDPRSYNSLAQTIEAMNSFSWAILNYYHHFTFSTDMTSSKAFSQEGINTLRAWMGGKEGSILDVYGGEWAYDRFSCFLTSRRGQDTGYRISYGKNLAEYEKQTELNEYSNICAYWKKSDEQATSDLIATGLDCALRVGYVDASKAFDSKPSTAQLNSYATAQIPYLVMGGSTITVTPEQIGSNIIGLGDSVLVCYETVFQTRVIKTVWDALTGRYNKLQLGTKKANIADTIKSLTTAPNGESGSSDVPEVYMNTSEWGLKKIGNIVEFTLSGKASGDVRAFTLPSGYRPSNFLSFPIVVVLNSKCYMGYMTLNANGAVYTYYYDYASASQTPARNAAIWATLTYFLG